MAPATPVVVNLDVTVDSSGNISVFGYPNPIMNNIIVASKILPVSCLYNSRDNALLRFQQLSSDANDIYSERNTSFSTLELTIATAIKAIINASFDCSGATPFTNYSADYHTQASLGKVFIASYADGLFGHVAATAAIDNDVAFVNYMNNDTAQDAAINKALARGLYSLSSSVATSIAKQVVGQDSSRAHLEDNLSNWQAVEFKSGDIIYMSVRLLQPIVSVSNAAQQSTPLSTDYTVKTYAMKITLWDGTGVNPKTGGSSGGGGGGGFGDFVLISYSQQSGVSTSSTAYGVNQSMILEPSPVGAPNSFSVTPSLPTGLSINTTTGVISGTPTQETTLTTYTVTATNTTNSASNTTDITFATVSTTAPTFTYYSLQDPDGSLSLTTNANSTFNPMTSDYIIEYSISPALPTSSSINSVSGELHIVPRVTAYPSTVHTITATNGVAASTRTLTLQIGALTPVSITYPQEGSTITLYWGQSFPSITPSLSGSPNSFSISPTLPTGMSFNTSTGVISGTPSQYQSAVSHTITATNTSTGLSDTSVLSIRVVSGGVLD